MRRIEKMPVGIVLERRASEHPWQDHYWAPVAVMPGAAPSDPADPWRILDKGEGWTRYLAGTLTVELYRTDTEAYRTNLSGNPPVVYVVLRDDDESEHELLPFAATASAFEAQDYLDSGEDIVEGVAMPDGMIAWVRKFIDTHHVDQPFVKRKRRRRDEGVEGSGGLAPSAEENKHER